MHKRELQTESTSEMKSNYEEKNNRSLGLLPNACNELLQCWVSNTRQSVFDLVRKSNLFQPIPAQKSNALIFDERF